MKLDCFNICCNYSVLISSFCTKMFPHLEGGITRLKSKILPSLRALKDIDDLEWIFLKGIMCLYAPLLHVLLHTLYVSVYRYSNLAFIRERFCESCTTNSPSELSELRSWKAKEIQCHFSVHNSETKLQRKKTPSLYNKKWDSSQKPLPKQLSNK